MKRFFIIIFILFVPVNLIFSQYGRYKESKYLIGFNLQIPRGVVPSIAFTNSPQSIKSSFGIGFVIQRKLTTGINLFMDINAYKYNIPLARKGTDIQSDGSVADNANPLTDPGAPQVQQINNLPTDLYFDMQSTGIRMGAKYILGRKKFRPWAGAALGVYDWEANYRDKGIDKTYGCGRGYLAGVTFITGVDIKLTSDKIISAYADFGSPVAKYTIKGLSNPEWNLKDYRSSIIGPFRLGITLSFAPRGSLRR